MFQQLMKKFQPGASESTEPEQFRVERLSALLLVEIARSDTSVDEVELTTIQHALQISCPSITSDEIEEILATARQDVETTISLHEQIRQINEGFTRAQKLSLIEQMWRVALADGDLDKYEEHMIRKLCGLLYVSHGEFIQAKLKVIPG
ncbi:hypothetical protein AB833_02045 [Chromatiales bacterium (ex Bugula neritina AB1)]|nr:hypothetical protein AB833_02045 [Chromatiales bacterium (ex Bugula neritina AB1)]